jgi:hypothetical protein
LQKLHLIFGCWGRIYGVFDRTPTVFDEPSSDVILVIWTFDDADSVSSCMSLAFGASLRVAACAMISRSRSDWREYVEEGFDTSLAYPSLDDVDVDLRISSARYDWSLSEETSACALAETDEEEERKASLEEPVKLRKWDPPADSLMGFESTSKE